MRNCLSPSSLNQVYYLPLGHLSRDTAPPKKKARKEIAGIITDWESRRKLTAATSLASFDADEDSMVKQGGMVSDDECNDAEREAVTKGPTAGAPQIEGKGKIVSDMLPNLTLLNNSVGECYQD